MTRRVWTEEEVNSIIEDYSNGGTFKELKHKYNAHYYSLKKALDTASIDTKHRNWTEEEINDIVLMYTIDGCTIATIREKHKCRTKAVSSILRDKGIDINSHLSVNRKIDHHFFEKIDTEQKAYFLGMLMADGSVRVPHREKPTVTLELIDLDVIEKLQQAVNGDSKITKSQRNRVGLINENPTYTVTLRSEIMAQDLAKQGVVPNKTYKTTQLELDMPEEMERHCLRGLFDGDGSIYHSNNRWFLALTNNHVSFLEDVQQMIIKHLPEIGVRKVYDGQTAARLTYSGKYAKEVINLLYSNNNVSMDRKQRLAKQAVEDIV